MRPFHAFILTLVTLLSLSACRVVVQPDPTSPATTIDITTTVDVPTTTTATTATTTTSASTTSATSAVTTTTPVTTTTTTSQPVYAQYPSPENTGLRASIIETINGDYYASENETISRKRITGELIVNHPVTIVDSEIYGQINNYSSQANIDISYSLLGPPTGCSGDFALGTRNLHANAVHVRNVGDAFRGSGDNVLIENSFALLCSLPGFHSDGYQGNEGGSNIVLKHNTFDQRQAPDSTAPIFNADGSLAITVEDNLIFGITHSLRIYDIAGQQSVVRDNKIVSGEIHSSCSAQWTGNVFVTANDQYQLTSTLAPAPCMS